MKKYILVYMNEGKKEFFILFHKNVFNDVSIVLMFVVYKIFYTK